MGTYWRAFLYLVCMTKLNTNWFNLNNAWALISLKRHYHYLKCILPFRSRSTMLIMQLVPDIEKFRITLRAIKLWAQAQGLYSNILGYLGGFSWAVLVAKVCMECPDLSAPELIQKFFHLFKSWTWPDPVSLTDIQQQVWNMCLFSSNQYRYR